MRDINEWLESLGLAEYARCFAENDVDIQIVRDLSDKDLQDIGVRSLGHRRRLLRAIGALAEQIPSDGPAPPLTQKAVERRQLTLMFCDLVGSTALSVRLDPEDLRRIINDYHRRCAEVIARFGGFVAKYMGDGLLAYFGYPHAHEDDAERAVRAGLALVEAVARIDGDDGTPLRVRVGIATGLVIAGDVIGEGGAQEQAVVGETPNLAARLQALAEPNTVIVDDNTHRLLGQMFEQRRLDIAHAKGFDGPLTGWQVMRQSAIDSRFEALRATTTPLVGRDEEIDLLMRRWQQAKGGEGCVALISGEAGIGKSRIAQTIVERISGDAHVRFRYFCSPHHQDTALYPTITHLERSAGFRREDTVEQRLDKLEAMLAQGTDDPANVMPLMATLLSIPTGNRYPPLTLSPREQKEKTIKALLAQVEWLSRRRPALIVIEDAQWSDPTSRELFDLLIDAVPKFAMLVIVTFRPEFAAPWVGRAHVSVLNINRMSSRRQSEMIDSVASKALPREIVDQIIDRADGVPLFVEELTKTVLESGVISDVGDRYVAAGPLSPLAIPTTLNASLLARLDRLAPVREIAQIGAALGRRFSHEMISAVVDMPPEQLDDALMQLVRSELMFRHGSPPDAEYTFKHVLVQDTAYSTMLHSRRQQLHGRIAAVLESRFPEIVESQPELVARHCTEAGLVDKAIGYWLNAGQRAIARWAIKEAEAQLRKGLDLVRNLPDGAARQEQELNFQMTLARALVAAKGYAAMEAGEAFARARELCNQLNRPSQLVRAVGGQFAFHLVRADLEHAENHANEMRSLGDAFGNTKWQAAGSAGSGCVCFYLGKFEESRRHYEDWLSLWDPTYRTVGSTPEDYYVQGVIHLCLTSLCLGHVDQARGRRDEAIAEARRLSPYTLASVLCIAWYFDWAIGGVRSAHAILAQAREILALSHEHGFPLWFAEAQIMRGWCLGAMNQPKEAIPLIREGLDRFRETGSGLILPFFLTCLAEVYSIAAEPQEGVAILAEAATLVEKTKERWFEAEMHRIGGMLLLSMQDHAAAEKSLRRALAVAQRQKAKLWELRAAADLARLWRGRGKCSAARDLLSPICSWFKEGLDISDLREAKLLLERSV